MASLATPAADVYSLGVLVHHLLGGSAPPPDAPLPVGDGSGRRRRRQGDRPRSEPAARVGRRAGVRAARRLAVPVRPDGGVRADPQPLPRPQAFEQADAADFFGRDRAIAEMVAVLERERLLVVVGPSGIGKSSVVKAGLVPALGRRCRRRFGVLAGHRDGAGPRAVRAARRGARAGGQRRAPRCGRRAHVVHRRRWTTSSVSSSRAAPACSSSSTSSRSCSPRRSTTVTGVTSSR